MKQMSDRDVRFEALKLVIENGSNLDRQNPIIKADQYVRYIMGTDEDKLPTEVVPIVSSGSYTNPKVTPQPELKLSSVDNVKTPRRPRKEK